MQRLIALHSYGMALFRDVFREQQHLQLNTFHFLRYKEYLCSSNEARIFNLIELFAVSDTT